MAPLEWRDGTPGRHARDMEIPGYRPCDVAYHIECLRHDGELLAVAAGRAGPGAPVPACPGWAVRDLLKHTGYVHRWATGYVAEQRTDMVETPAEDEMLTLGPPDDVLLDWFRDGHASLVRALAAADPDLKCWTFMAAPSPLAFWARRQSHETAIHRLDTQQAAAEAGERGPGPVPASGPGPVPARLAADGVDELLTGFLPRAARRRSWQPSPGTLGVHADDGPDGTAHWLVAMGPGQAEVTRGAGPADCDITGPAADLYLLLWNRRDARDLDVNGDASRLATLRDQLRVTWR
jgi:uncharacterized protein (TIGR03083 family)